MIEGALSTNNLMEAAGPILQICNLSLDFMEFIYISRGLQ